MSGQLGEHVKEALGVKNPEAQGSTDATADPKDVENPITYYLVLTKLYVSFNKFS